MENQSQMKTTTPKRYTGNHRRTPEQKIMLTTLCRGLYERGLNLQQIARAIGFSSHKSAGYWLYYGARYNPYATKPKAVRELETRIETWERRARVRYKYNLSLGYDPEKSDIVKRCRERAAIARQKLRELKSA